jgi:hypothetical protein
MAKITPSALTAILLFFSIHLSAQRGASNETTEDKLRKLETVHKHVFNLPYEYEFIRETVMGEVEQMRSKVAPNFPKKDPESNENRRELFKAWVERNPEELERYIAEVKAITLKYAK